MKKLPFRFLTLALGIIGLTGLLFLLSRTVIWLGQAEGIEANILVDPAVDQGPITPFWRSLAQGGEEQYPFDPIIEPIAELKPTYIRIDHIFDFYQVAEKQEGKLIFDWIKLDRLVNQILATGATPFFSLSYLPPQLAVDSQVTNPPLDWNDWAELVKETIEHYSGKSGLNLNNVIYEVWNEPDLFGQWKIGGQKDYTQLYERAIQGARQVQNSNPFKIGGPATAAPYQTWTSKFLDWVSQNRLRLDFYSWHRYDPDPLTFRKDLDRIDTWLFRSGATNVEKYLTEWGPTSENSSLNDNYFAAAHLIATARQLLGRVDLAFVFEIKDGPDPAGNQYWGRWGLLTHQNPGPIEKKPRYQALNLLNKMEGKRISLSGEGTWVTGFASQTPGKTKIILANLDLKSKHSELVPLSLINLKNGSYLYQETFLPGVKNNQTILIENNRLSRQVSLSANQIVLIELMEL